MERCKECRYFHRLKEFKNCEWQYKDICTYFIQTEETPKYETWAMVVDESAVCECFAERKEKNEIHIGQEN